MPATPPPSDPVAGALHDLQDPRGHGWIFRQVGDAKEHRIAWEAIEIALGWLEFLHRDGSLDKAIYWLEYAVAAGYPGADRIARAAAGLRDALLKSEIDHLTGDDPQRECVISDAFHTLAASLVDAAHDVAQVLIDDAKIEVERIISNVRSQARNRGAEREG